MIATTALPISLVSAGGDDAPEAAATITRASKPGAGWPPVCTLAELGRILTMVHGVKAPTDSTLKKWSAAGEFRGCISSGDTGTQPPPPSPHIGAALSRPSRGGRPGLRLRTAAAIGRVYELWPFLADSDPQAVLELAVARTADQFRSALGPAFSAAGNLAHRPLAASRDDDTSSATLRSVQEQIGLLSQEMAAVRRELAQFSALRNNLITRLDDVVARAKEAVAGNVTAAAPNPDPLAEARRDRDMGVMKSTLSEILAALERIEAGRSSRP